MPMVCAVFGCSNRANRDIKSYYRVPKVVTHKGEKWKKISENRRKKWLDNLRLLSDGAKSPYARVCSDHFVNGRPSKLGDADSVDWAPTINLGYNNNINNAPTKSEPLSSAFRTDRTEFQEMRNEVAWPSDECQQDDPNNLLSITEDAGCQTDLTMEDIRRMEDVLHDTTKKLAELTAKALDSKFQMDAFKDNEDKTKFYTGLPNFLVLLQVFKLCETYISSCYSLSKFEQLILVLMKLRLDFSLQDLAYRFKISCATASRIWHELVYVLHKRLDFLIEWPERHILQATMPMSFREAFGNRVAVIVDCFEVFIEKPSSLLARAQTCCSYKHHHTVKFLIGAAPQGYVTFISAAWGGRVSDKQMVEESGLLKKLLPGDVVLADRGFSVQESAGFYCASLELSPFTKGKKQLTAFEVEHTRKIANVRIHVERVIGLVRRKYQILQNRSMTIEHLATKQSESESLIDKVGVICCALSNLSESVVPPD